MYLRGDVPDGEALSPDLAKCNGDPRPNLDESGFSAWQEMLSTFSELSIHDRISALNFIRELKRGGESARTIGLTEALAEVDRVIGASQGKHPKSRWRTYGPKVHQGKLLRHLGSWLAGEQNDSESGRPHLAHLAARALMLLAVALEAEKH